MAAAVCGVQRLPGSSRALVRLLVTDRVAVQVGGGMVGASLALRFSQAGLQVAVIEKTPPPPIAADAPIDLRVSAINRRSEQWLRDIGVWQQLPAQRMCPYRALQAFEGESKHHHDGLV